MYVCEPLTKQAPPRFESLSLFLEILSQPGYLSDFHDQWLIWKIITEPTRQSNNITVLCKENIEEIAVEKSIFPADILVRVILFPAKLKLILLENNVFVWRVFTDMTRHLCT